MTINVNVYFHNDRIETKLEQILSKLENIKTQQRNDLMTIQDAFDTMTTKVTALETVEASAEQLLHDLADMIRNNANAPTPESWTSLADRIDSRTASLSAAVVASTPSA
jgi:predicted nucleotide-binding protein (sugar kinase/HSP70/actin superfamily)